MNATRKRNEVINAILLYVKECRTEDDALRYMRNAYDQGICLDTLYEHFVLNAPTGI